MCQHIGWNTNMKISYNQWKYLNLVWVKNMLCLLRQQKLYISEITLRINCILRMGLCYLNCYKEDA
jgi:hypothetical protein